MDDYDIDLELAIACWENGEDIPLDHEAVLLEKGYDVCALRDQHLN